jgi:hypothetical protein
MGQFPSPSFVEGGDGCTPESGRRGWDGGRLAGRRGGIDPMTGIIVDKIVVLAKAGEHDADRLAELVLNDLVDDGLAAAS